MKTRTEVKQILELHRKGYNPHRISRVLGCSRSTVVRYLRKGRWEPARRPPGRLSGLEEWLEERFRRHDGNADVVRQELRRVHGIEVSLRTVERAVQPLPRQLRAARLASVRFESIPGDQMQIDFASQGLCQAEWVRRRPTNTTKRRPAPPDITRFEREVEPYSPHWVLCEDQSHLRGSQHRRGRRLPGGTRPVASRNGVSYEIVASDAIA